MPFFGLGSKNKKEKDPIKEKARVAYYAKYVGEFLRA
jgi:hypothetical protein